ncbi:SMI1/KNR4 family protein [Streptomyces sp. NPDC060131]|uniref:SMI1/KNR4 family protein n=1 Tax=unclassified Streptomyces TaxID=2593676 RepID=UPI0036592407
MAVDIPADVQERCKDLGQGVGYALKVLCIQLEDNPLLGTPLEDPSLYTARIDGETFEDCPELNVRYAYGPPLLTEGQVQIRSVEGTRSLVGESDEDGGEGGDGGDGREGHDQAPDPRLEELGARQVARAWQGIESWLREHAPASYASLRAGASEDEIAALEAALGVQVPAGLKALWRLRAGVHRVAGAGFLLENQALMTPDAVIAFHQQQMLSQQQGGDDEFTIWKPSWIPVCSFGVGDHTYGLYLDTETGQLCHWSRYAERWPEFESLTTYLEEMEDALAAPSLVTGARPGLVNGALMWGPPNWPDPEAPWVPFTR